MTDRVNVIVHVEINIGTRVSNFGMNNCYFFFEKMDHFVNSPKENKVRNRFL